HLVLPEEAAPGAHREPDALLGDGLAHREQPDVLGAPPGLRGGPGDALPDRGDGAREVLGALRHRVGGRGAGPVRGRHGTPPRRIVLVSCFFCTVLYFSIVRGERPVPPTVRMLSETARYAGGRPACSVACREKRRPGARRPRGAEINGGRRWQAVCRVRRGPAAPRVSGETQGGRFGLPRPPPPTCAGERPLTGRYRRDQRLPAGRPAAVAAALSRTARRVRGE